MASQRPAFIWQKPSDGTIGYLIGKLDVLRVDYGLIDWRTAQPGGWRFELKAPQEFVPPFRSSFG